MSKNAKPKSKNAKPNVSELDFSLEVVAGCYRNLKSNIDNQMIELTTFMLQNKNADVEKFLNKILRWKNNDKTIFLIHTMFEEMVTSDDFTFLSCLVELARDLNREEVCKFYIEWRRNEFDENGCMIYADDGRSVKLVATDRSDPSSWPMLTSDYDDEPSRKFCGIPAILEAMEELERRWIVR